ncbi:MAG: radical SAM family heme chaperone HemW [Acidiferrobacteraceae bacterium]
MLEPQAIPCALYIHLPWCVRKCPYCDFNSYEGAMPDEAHYVHVLLADLEAELAHAPERTISSIFIGGGTPSLFSGAAIAELLAGVRARVVLAPDCEITIEANPGAADEGRFRSYRNAGVNRLSIGVQSFNDHHLRALGRIHDGARALEAAHSARAASFDNMNLDLMYGLPGQDAQDFAQDLETALRIGPEHLSVYQLTIEEGTPFAHRPPPRPDDREIEAMEQVLRDRLVAEGYLRYEISAYARGRYRCRHNLNYWMFGDYIGIGAGAHGKISRTNGVFRHQKPRQPQAYLRGRGTGLPPRRLSEDELLFEFMLNLTRLPEGFPVSLFTERTGQHRGRLLAALAPACARGLAVIDGEHVRSSALGLQFLNDLQALFLPPSAPCHAAGG